jgi:hypothetical protein
MISFLTTQNTAGNQAIPFTGVNFLFEKATFYGYSGFDPSGIPLNNTSPINIGVGTGAFVVVIGTGGSYTWSQPTSRNRESLSNFYLRAPVTHGCYVVAY